VMDGFAALSMNRLVIANAVKQSMTSDCMDRHGLRPRDDGAGSRSACGSGPDTRGLAMTKPGDTGEKI
jgi:hypothetical protein